MKPVVTFGEYLLRLNPEGYFRFSQAEKFYANYTGAEANVAVSLSNFGLETQYVTKVPDNDIAHAGVSLLKKFDVGTKNIIFGGDRLGLYYLEKGASQRPSKIVYDRKYSAIAMMEKDEFDWENILEGAGCFHFTGITPALGPKLPEICLNACKAAKKLGVTVSCDLNYRKNLWTQEQAKETMEKLLEYVDILIANEEDADKVLGIKASSTDVVAGTICGEGYIDVASQICRKYGVSMVGVTLRESISASDNIWGAMLYTDGQPYFSKKYKVHIVDRVGGGDSFAAGLIYGYVQKFDPQKITEFAAAASCLKHSIEFDYNLTTVDEVMRLMSGDGSGRVQR